MTLYIKLKQRRTEAQMTQEQLAKEIGVSTRQIIRWEHGESMPSPRLKKKLEEALNQHRKEGKNGI